MGQDGDKHCRNGDLVKRNRDLNNLANNVSIGSLMLWQSCCCSSYIITGKNNQIYSHHIGRTYCEPGESVNQMSSDSIKSHVSSHRLIAEYFKNIMTKNNFAVIISLLLFSCLLELPGWNQLRNPKKFKNSVISLADNFNW